MRGVLYRTEKDGTTLAVPELRISASNSRTVYYENNAAKQSALNNNEIREGSIVLTGLAGNNEDYATKAYVDSKIGNSEHQVGVIVGFPGNVPNGYLLCDGNRFDKNEYPELYKYLGTDVLPDYRECVLVGAGQNTTDSIATHDVYTVGQFKDDQIQNITGKIGTHGMGGGADIPFGIEYLGAFYAENREYSRPKILMNDDSRTRRNIVFDASRVARAGSTTHGKQKGLNWAIKAAPITISSSPIQSDITTHNVPNWNGIISFTYAQANAGYVVPSDGQIFIRCSGNGTTTITVNGQEIFQHNTSASFVCSVSPVVGKGDLVKYTGPSNTWDGKLVPFKN